MERPDSYYKSNIKIPVYYEKRKRGRSMTKSHRGKKAIASFLAGLFLLQGAFAGGSVLHVNAKDSVKKMKFEIVGE